MIFSKKPKPKGLLNKMLGKKLLSEAVYYNSMIEKRKRRRLEKKMKELGIKIK